MQVAWFSIGVGWLLKVLIVKYGGARMYQQSRSFFIGLIFGQALAAALWLVVTLALVACGIDYELVKFLPT